ncbi:MAG: DUF3854 domain-containing protein [Phormidesmis sp. CAN_BIN44]|nr:DUF3854 domain-containing protein [Phormidesmis sp. CAN_BIN44]
MSVLNLQAASTLETFQQRFEIECVQGSAIDSCLYSAAIEIVEDTGYFEPNEFLGQKVSRQWQTHKPHNYGALAVLCNEDKAPWQAKPENPRVNHKTGKEQKYESIKGRGARAFLPAVDVETWVRIAQKNQLVGFLPTWVSEASANGRKGLVSHVSGKLTPAEFKSYDTRLRSTSATLLPRATSVAKGFFLPTGESICQNSQRQQNSTSKKTQTIQCNISDSTQTTENIRFKSPQVSTGYSQFDRSCPTSPLKESHRLQTQFAIETSSFWEWVELLPVQIILTEGGKKSLCLLSHGYVAIAIYGAWGGVVENEIIGGEKVRKLKPELIPDLQRFAVPKRSITIALDQDDRIKTRADVDAAQSRLGSVLTFAGCEVTIAQWSQSQGKGVDDLIVNCGVEAWEKSYSEADSFIQWSIARALRNEMRRKPDLNIGDREFIEVVSELPREGIVALHGGKGTSKSKAIGELLKGQKWISITHSTAVGRDQAAWGGVFVNDGDRHGSKLLKDGVPVDGGSVCVPSLLKVSAVEADVLVLDEITATLEFLLGSKLANKDGIRPLLLAEFTKRIREARLVLIADADLTEKALQFIEAIRGGRAYLVRSERKALTYEATIIDGTKNSALALLQERISNAPDGKIFYINTDSKAYAETLAEILGRDISLLVTSDTSGGEVEASLLTSKGRDLPGLVARGIRFIISSPSIVQGFSFEHHTDLIDSVWGFYQGCSISAHSIAQAPDRVRDSVPRFFWVAKKGSATSRLSKAQTVTTFLKEFKQLNSTAARLVANSLTPDVQITVDRLDWQSQNLRMLAAIETRRNRGMFALRETLIALLKKEGKRVSILKPQFSKAEIRAIGALVSGASDAVKTRHHDAVAASETITKETATALSEQSDPLTPEQVLSLEKFYISEFYRLETVMTVDVKFDRNGRTRSQIKALEAVLFPQVATETTAKSINQNSENPQDWNPLAVKGWLLEKSTAAVLIRRIASGEVETLTPDLTDPIVEFIRKHPTEFGIAFNFRNIENLSDQQIIGEILSRHGIKTKRRGKKENIRYEVQKPQLDEILAIIERRKKEVAPHLDQGIDQGGVTSSKPDEWAAWKTPDQRELIREWLQVSQSDPEQAHILRASIPIEVLRWAIA